MKSGNQKTNPDHLSVVMTLSKQLSKLFSPAEQLLAYCKALEGLCPWAERIYVAPFREGDEHPSRIFFYERSSKEMKIRNAQDLTREEKRFIEGVFRLKIKGKGDRGQRAREEGYHLLEDTLGAEEAGLTKSVQKAPAPSEKEKGSASPLNLTASLPLETGSGLVEGWIHLAGSKKKEGLWKDEARNAVSVCTDMLSASLERTNLFEKVLRAKKEWERSVDAIRDAVMIIGPDRTVRRGNRHLAELAGVSVKALQGKKCHRLLASLEDACPSCPAGITAETGQEAEAEVFRPEHEAIFQVWSYPILDPSGRLDSLAVYEKDITEIKRMQEKLVLAEKMAVLGQMAAAVAHELNNPLSGVISLSKILLGEMDPGLSYVEDLKNIEQAALRCKKIVQDLLVFSRKPDHTVHGSANLQAVMEQVYAILSPKLEERGIRMDWELQEEIPELPYHPDPLQQILVNLISNARDAMDKGGEIRIRAQRREQRKKDYLVISVQDTGPGIKPRDREKIFDAFYTTKKPGEGTGLGLSICQRLMESFDGWIEVSSSEGKGTAFFLWFPFPRNENQEE